MKMFSMIFLMGLTMFTCNPPPPLPPPLPPANWLIESTFGASMITGNGSVINLSNAIDGNLDDFATLEVGGGIVSTADIFLSGPTGLSSEYKSAVLNATVEIPEDSLMPPAASLFQLFYGTDGYSSTGVINAPNIGLLRVMAPMLQTKTTVSAVLPLGLDLSKIALRFDAVSNGSTSGLLQVRVYGAWIEIKN